MGYSFGLLLAALARLGLTPDPTAEIAGAVTAMRSIWPQIQAQTPVCSNPAKRLAGQWVGRAVTIIGSDILEPVARRVTKEPKPLKRRCWRSVPCERSMPRLRTETKVRARALQLLYAWEMQGKPTVQSVVDGLSGLGKVPNRSAATRLARRVTKDCDTLDREIEASIEGWRLERVGAIERNILRLALAELLDGQTPAPVVIDEAVRLAH